MTRAHLSVGLYKTPARQQCCGAAGLYANCRHTWRYSSDTAASRVSAFRTSAVSRLRSGFSFSSIIVSPLAFSRSACFSKPDSNFCATCRNARACGAYCTI